MIRNCLANQVYNIDNTMVDQVWFQSKCIPAVLFGFCYVPPMDSSYFNHQLFANLHEKINDYNGFNNICIIGDMNARFGSTVSNLLSRSSNPCIQACSYPVIEDDISSPNNSAFLLSSICVDNELVVLNNIKSSVCHFQSKKTFKRANQWISEIDTCVVSFDMLNSCNEFLVH